MVNVSDHINYSSSDEFSPSAPNIFDQRAYEWWSAIWVAFSQLDITKNANDESYLEDGATLPTGENADAALISANAATTVYIMMSSNWKMQQKLYTCRSFCYWVSAQVVGSCSSGVSWDLSATSKGYTFWFTVANFMILLQAYGFVINPLNRLVLVFKFPCSYFSICHIWLNINWSTKLWNS